jgi:hypothetical protein
VTSRREFTAALPGGAFAFLQDARGQQPANIQRPTKAWRIGCLARGIRPPDTALPAALRQALHDLGYVDQVIQ